jgi:2-polyprenyl-3-methyl-5-hydroxy-6-metoxy-1,4-benzoquinol methylase
MSGFDGGEYQRRFDALAAGGMDVHGEATFVRSLLADPGAGTVLDAGCGTGRVAIELANHGITTLGVDADHSMITEARLRAPMLEWLEADLTELPAALEPGARFTVVVLAGNVPLFTPPGTEDALVRGCAERVAPGGALVAGFQLGRGYDLAAYDASCASAGLELEDRYATWDREPFRAGDYAVSVHRRP